MSGAAGLQSWIWGPCSRLGLGVAAVTLLLDQAHKWWMLEIYRIAERGRVSVTPFLDLVFVKNIGISYSLFDQDSYAGQIMLAGFGVVASLALWVWMARGGSNRLMAASLGLIIGGALGNAIGRWQRRAESPMSSRDVADASRVVIRTCEGLLVSLG